MSSFIKLCCSLFSLSVNALNLRVDLTASHFMSYCSPNEIKTPAGSIYIYISITFSFLFEQLLFLIPVMLLLLEVSQTHGRYRTRKRYRYRHRYRIRVTKPPTTTAPTPRPTSQNATIPRERCKIIADELPKKRIQGPICLRLNETQLLTRLKERGTGYNPRYMAVNREEALKFVDLTLDQLPIPTNVSQGNQSLLEGVLTGEATTNRRKRSVTTLRPCRPQGSATSGNFRRLCTECPAFSELPGVFPPFINEVICGDERFCFRNIGGCQQQILRFNFLRFTGDFERDDDLSEEVDDDVFVEELGTFEQDIRACCQCRGFSFFGGK